jgi:anti-sigma B factor antagonist
LSLTDVGCQDRAPIKRRPRFPDGTVGQVQVMGEEPAAHLVLDRSTDATGRVCLAVAGAVDLVTADQLGAAILNALHEPQVADVVLDFARLDFIDSIGIDTLVTGLRVADKRKIGYRVVNARGKVRAHLHLLGLDELLAAEPDGRPDARDG